MRLLKYVYVKTHKREAPYYYNYSLLKIIGKPIRKFFTNCVAYNCPFNCIRILIYKCCGFKIGKNVFIGMKCYLDDMCYDLITIGNNVIISYGVYTACHGRNQQHIPLIIKDNVYIGMRANIITKCNNDNKLIIGEHAVIGACTLVNKSVPDYATAVGIPCRIINNIEVQE